MSSDFEFDFVFLLPLIAVAIGVFYPLSVTVVHTTKSLKKPQVRVIMLRRLVIFVLLVSTIMAIMFPFHGLSNIAKALLLCAAVLLPAYVAHVYLKISGKLSGKRRREVRGKHSDADEVAEMLEPKYQTRKRLTQSHTHSSEKHTVKPLARTSKDTLRAPIDLVLDEE